MNGTRPLWPLFAAAALVAGCFFGIEHLPDASTRPDYAPSEEDMLSNQSRGDLARRVCFLGIAAAGAAGVVLGRAGRWAGGGVYGLVVLAFFGWQFASVLWSDLPKISARRLVILGMYLLGAAGLAKALTGRQLVWAAILAVLGQLAVGVLAELALGTLRPWRGDYRFAGTIHPNMQALQLGVGIVAAVALYARPAPGRGWGEWERVRFPLLVALAGTFTVVATLTKSRTSCAGILAAAAGVGVYAASGPVKLLLAAFTVGGAAAGLAVVLLTGADPTADARRAALMGREGQSGTLSGRLEIWEALHPYAAARPLGGYGYAAFWSEERLYAVQSEAGFKFAASHSAWYEATLTAGLPFALLLLALLLGGLVRALRVGRRPHGAGRDGSGGANGAGGTGGPHDPLPAFAFGVLILAALNSLLEAIIADVRLTPFLMHAALLKMTFLPDRPAPAPPFSAPPPPPPFRPPPGVGGPVRLG